MTQKHPVICIGSALWDTIARTERAMEPGNDVPGQIRQRPGGVALNVSFALAQQNVDCILLTAIGRDAPGDLLTKTASDKGVNCAYLTRVDDATDTYLAIEQSDGTVFGAVADCATLEKTGAEVLVPLINGDIASESSPFQGTVVIDGNLPEDVLDAVLNIKGLAQANMVFVPASPGKAERLRSVLASRGGTIFVNIKEAEILCNTTFKSSKEAAAAISALGAGAIVTDGPDEAAMSKNGVNMTVLPPAAVNIATVTGAGDAFLAGFLAFELKDEHLAMCLSNAADVASAHVSGKTL